MATHIYRPAPKKYWNSSVLALVNRVASVISVKFLEQLSDN
jgi:hypothetical protein